MAKHYHVLVGMGGGYMPDCNDYCSTRASAEDTALWHANDWRQDEEYRVRGNKRDGYRIGRPGSDHDLGHYIEIVACQESDCSSEED